MKNKKKNKKNIKRKGFTLIELLAVIVILAIVLVVTIPSVISSMKSAKEKQLQNSADIVADWLNKQLAAAKLGEEFVSEEYKEFINSDDYTCLDEEESENCILREYNLYEENDEAMSMLKAAGVSNPEEDLNLFNSKVIINTADDYASVFFEAKDGGSFSIGDNQINKTLSTGATEHGIEEPALFNLSRRNNYEQTGSLNQNPSTYNFDTNSYIYPVAYNGKAIYPGKIGNVSVTSNSISYISTQSEIRKNYGVLVPFKLAAKGKYKLSLTVNNSDCTIKVLKYSLDQSSVSPETISQNVVGNVSKEFTANTVEGAITAIVFAGADSTLNASFTNIKLERIQ